MTSSTYNTAVFRSLLREHNLDDKTPPLTAETLRSLRNARKALLREVEDPNAIAESDSLCCVPALNRAIRELKEASGPTATGLFKAVYQCLSFPIKRKELTDNDTIERQYRSLLEREEANRVYRPDKTSPVLLRARKLCALLFGNIDMTYANVVRHLKDGNGAVYNHDNTTERANLGLVSRLILKQYPLDMFDYDPFNREVLEQIKITPRSFCRVVSVPKDVCASRQVFIHETANMRVQQAQMTILANHLEHHCSGFVELKNQKRNQDLAFVGSFNREFATIDLSDASDRISLGLFGFIMPRNLKTPLLCTRAEYMVGPFGTVPRIRMFAPMGSAVCFPVQSIIFLCIVLAAVTLQDRLVDNKLLKSKLRRYEDRISVYGDDIIVPAEYATSVVNALTLAGLSVNLAKTFYRGPFRESCGLDAYDGNVVTPVYQRYSLDEEDSLLTKRFRDRQGDYEVPLQGHISTRNQLWERGFTRTATLYEDLLQSKVGFLPASAGKPDTLWMHAPNAYNWNLRRFPCRIGPYHTLEFLTQGPYVKRHSLIGDRCLLNRWFFRRKGGEDPYEATSSTEVNWSRSTWRAL